AEKPSHDDTRQNGSNETFITARFIRLLRDTTIGYRGKNKGDHNADDTEEQNERIALRIADIGGDHTQSQCQPHTHRKSYRHTGKINRSDQKNIGNIEDNPCQYCRHQTTAARLLNIRYKTATGFAHRTQREGK